MIKVVALYCTVVDRVVVSFAASTVAVNMHSVYMDAVQETANSFVVRSDSAIVGSCDWSVVAPDFAIEEGKRCANVVVSGVDSLSVAVGESEFGVFLDFDFLP